MVPLATSAFGRLSNGFTLVGDSRRLIGCTLAFLVTGLEILCLVSGFALPDSGAPPDVRRIWIEALVSIPVSGLFAAWVVSRRQLGARIAGAGCVCGSLLALYWGWIGVVSKFDESRFPAGLIASMAFTSSLLLAGGGMKHIIAMRRYGRRSTGP